MKAKSTLPVLNAAIAVWLTAMIGLPVAALAQTGPHPAGGYRTEETRLGPWDYFPLGKDSVHAYHPAVSLDGRHVAYLSACPKGTKGCVLLLLDGQDVQSIALGAQEAHGFALSSDGKRFAYTSFSGGNKGGRWVVVVDGRAGPEYDGLNLVSPLEGSIVAGPDDLIFSPDGKCLAYVVRKGHRHSSSLAVVDGEAGAEYSEVLRPVFSPDSRRVAYAAKIGKKWSVVVDGQAGPAYDELRIAPYPLPFSPDSKHLAYAAKRSGKWVVVVDGQEGAEYRDIGGVVFSADGKRVAYPVFDRGWSVMADGQVGPKFESILNPGFSPDGSHVAYVAERRGVDKIWTLVVDGQAGAAYSSIGIWTFSPDGRHVAYPALMSGVFSDTSGNPYRAGKWSVVLDGTPGAEYSEILPRTLVFSPDGALEFLTVKREVHSLFGDHGSLYRVKYIPTP